MTRYTLKHIADHLGADLIGDGSLSITRIRHPSEAEHPTDLVLAMDTSLAAQLSETPARCAVIGPAMTLPKGPIVAHLQVKRPRVALAKLTQLFDEPITNHIGIHPTAIIENNVTIGNHVSVGAHSYIGEGAILGERTIIHPQVYIGPHAIIGKNSTLHSGVRIGHHVEIGERALIHFNTSIGSDGFSFVTPQKGSVETAKESGTIDQEMTNSELIRIYSLGSVIIGNDVEIGSNTSIDRGTLKSTRIGNGTKIDNQVQIGHNVMIGDNCMLCGRVGVAGSTEIGNRVVLGGAVGVADHLHIGDDVLVMAMSGVASNLKSRTIVGGIPALPRDRMIQNLFNIGRIRQIIKKIEALTERLETLEKPSKKD